jgi:hypothetical protein
MGLDSRIAANHYFNAKAAHWRAAGKNPRHSHVKVGARFCRISYHMVAGRQVFRHPCLRDRGYILDKLLTFHTEHQRVDFPILTWRTQRSKWNEHLPGYKFQMSWATSSSVNLFAKHF